ncbi:MAG: hypothetical protein FWF66_03880 [Candidatus Bathyarchaeota archaeon]|nr:hypothetical protein [Candidatus Termiticorpusculum sp.]
MNPNIIQEPVTYDGITVVVGKVRLVVKECMVEGVDFSFTPKYGSLLLQDETRVEAQHLLCEIAGLPLSDNAKQDLIHQAYDKGFKMAQLELERYKQCIPTSEPKFYSEVGYGKQLERHLVSLVSSERALRFYVSADMNNIISQLPNNVYCSCITYTGLSLTPERYRLVLGREKEFFGFVEELIRYTSYVRGDACSVCYRTFFEDTQQAYELLRVIGGRVGGRECRDQLFQTLERKGYLEFSLGLFVRSGWSTFYVSNDGDVQRFCRCVIANCLCKALRLKTMRFEKT